MDPARSPCRGLRRGAGLSSAMWLPALGIGALFLGAPQAAAAQTEEEPTFVIEFHDGKVAPLRLEVPAGRRFKIELRNTGAAPAEFESNELRKEKVLAPDSTSVMVVRSLDPGEYAFFDDFHPDAPQAVLVAK